MIPKYIKEALLTKERVVVSGLGTFSSEEETASISENGSLITPPSSVIEFNDNVFDLGENSLSKYVCSRHEITSEEIQKTLQKHLAFKQTIPTHSELIEEDMAQDELPHFGSIDEKFDDPLNSEH